MDDGMVKRIMSLAGRRSFEIETREGQYDNLVVILELEDRVIEMTEIMKGKSYVACRE
jgi:hypothetical protein